MWLVHDERVTRWRMSNFIIFISFIWHPWLMTKWHGHSIVITMIKRWLQVIWYEHRQPYPPPHLFMYPPNYLPPTHPPTYLLTYLNTHHLNANPLAHDPPTYLPTWPPTHPITYLPTHSPTYLITLFTYLPPIYHFTTCYLSHNLVVIWNKHVK